MKKLIALVLVAVMAACLFAGCVTEPIETTDPSNGTANPSTTEGTGGNEGNGATAPKTLSIAISENLTTLDPHSANNAPSYQVRNMCFDMLVEADHEGNYEPSLATEWTTSEDGTEITFNLRQGVKWQDGTEFTSADVVATFQRLIDDKTLNISSIYWALLAGVEAIDEYTVKIVLSEPYAAVLNSLSVTAIIQAKEWEERGVESFNSQEFTGTGPWCFDEWVDGQYFHVTKNPDYWNKANYDPYYDDVYVRVILEASTAVASHIAGDVQAYIASSGIDNDMLSLYAGSESTIELYKMETGTVQYVGLQCAADSVFADRNVRLAFIEAIDRQAIADSIFSGNAVVPDTCIVEGVLGFSADIAHYDYNPADAQALLEASGYDGSEIVLSSNTGTQKAQETLLAISEMLNAVGFNTSVQIVESATLNDMRASGEYDAFMIATMQENGESYKYFNMRVLNDAHHSNFVDEELNAVIQASNTEMDTDARRALLEQAAALWSQDLVHIPIVQLSATYAINYGVTGIGLYKDGLFNFKFVNYEG